MADLENYDSSWRDPNIGRMLRTVSSGRISEVRWTGGGRVTRVDTQLEEDGEIRTYKGWSMAHLLDRLFGNAKVDSGQRVTYLPWA